MIKLEKRNVYIKEFWTMSYRDRLIYEVVNNITRAKWPERNPLKMSIYSTCHWIIFISALAVVLMMAPYAAHRLKSRPMPKSEDRGFKDYDDWFVKNQWVVKYDKN